MAGSREGVRWHRIWASLALVLGACVIAASPTAAMRSAKIAPHLCKTVNGGRFVGIPGFPGERIDRRLLPDIRWMKRRFDIFITDGYSTDPVHAGNGEHPIGLAIDIVPNVAKAGTWNEIGELAHLAEPKQDEPIMPWRWVGWNGDSGHGRGNHLHLSWSHSPTRPRHPARVVYTRRCPRSGDDNEPPTGGDRHRRRPGPNGGTGAGGGSGGGGSSGGTSAGSGGTDGGGRRSMSGGTSPKVGRLAPVVPEAD
jgi:uncharacterized membrane protein YgcG